MAANNHGSHPIAQALREIRRRESLVVRASNLQPAVFHDWLGAAEDFARTYPEVRNGDLCLQVIQTWIRPIPELQSAGRLLALELDRMARAWASDPARNGG